MTVIHGSYMCGNNITFLIPGKFKLPVLPMLTVWCCQTVFIILGKASRNQSINVRHQTSLIYTFQIQIVKAIGKQFNDS